MIKNKNYDARKLIALLFGTIAVILTYTIFTFLIFESTGKMIGVSMIPFGIMLLITWNYINNHYKKKHEEQKALLRQDATPKIRTGRNSIKLDQTDIFLRRLALTMIFGGFIALVIIMVFM